MFIYIVATLNGDTKYRFSNKFNLTLFAIFDSSVDVALKRVFLNIF